MNKSESIKELISSTLKVMEEVKGIDKTLNVGTGNSSYKGVADQEVKKIIGEAMQRNGLSIFPIGIEESTQLSEWDELDQYSKVAGGTKRKQSLFTKVKTSYLLAHISGEFIEIVGYGHGVDSQDKSAGKATTYALKYALLYTFLIPTGKIDDADNTHSEQIQAPQEQHPTPQPKTIVLSPELEKQLTQAIATLESIDTIEKVKAVWENLPELHSNQIFKNEVNKSKKRIENGGL